MIGPDNSAPEGNRTVSSWPSGTASAYVSGANACHPCVLDLKDRHDRASRVDDFTLARHEQTDHAADRRRKVGPIETRLGLQKTSPLNPRNPFNDAA